MRPHRQFVRKTIDQKDIEEIQYSDLDPLDIKIKHVQKKWAPNN